MQQHLGRLDGVKKVDVSLVDGKVAIFPKEDSKFDPAAILKATYDSGVSVAEMTVTAQGTLAKGPQGLLFKISPNQTFNVAPGPESAKLEVPDSGMPIKLRGRLYKKPPGKAKKKIPEVTQLEILEVIK